MTTPADTPPPDAGQPEIAPCPFCGSPDGVAIDGTVVHMQVYCHGCEAQGPLSSVPEIFAWPIPAEETAKARSVAIERWNKSAPLAPPCATALELSEMRDICGGEVGEITRTPEEQTALERAMRDVGRDENAQSINFAWWQEAGKWQSVSEFVKSAEEEAVSVLVEEHDGSRPWAEGYIQYARQERHKGDCGLAPTWRRGPITCVACTYEDAMTRAFQRMKAAIEAARERRDG
jgi:hypothetical protein